MKNELLTEINKNLQLVDGVWMVRADIVKREINLLLDPRNNIEKIKEAVRLRELYYAIPGEFSLCCSCNNFVLNKEGVDVNDYTLNELLSKRCIINANVGIYDLDISRKHKILDCAKFEKYIDPIESFIKRKNNTKL